jgi:hypothetical protein
MSFLGIDPGRQGAIAAMVPEKDIVEGPLPALRRLSRMVKRDQHERRKRKRQAERASRRANR